MRQLLIDGFNDLHGVCGSTATFGSSTVNCLTDEETIFEDLELGGISEEIDGALQLLKDDFTVIPDAGDKFTFDGKQFRVARVQTDFADPILTVAYTFLQDIATNSKQGTASITIGGSATATHEENTTTNATGSAGITISSSATASTHTVNSASASAAIAISATGSATTTSTTSATASAAIALSAVAYATLQSVTSSSGSAAISIGATGTATTTSTTSASGSAAIAISATATATTSSITNVTGTAAIAISATGSATTTSTTSASGSAGITIDATGTATTASTTSATGSAAITVSATGSATISSTTSSTGSAAIAISATATATHQTQEDQVEALTDKLLWLDADSITGKSDGDSVSSWTSRHSSSVSASNSTSSTQPVYSTDEINSLPAIDFDADFLEVDYGTNTSQPLTAFIVCKYDVTSGGGSNNAIDGRDNPSGYRGVNFSMRSTGWGTYAGSAWVAPASGSPDTNWHIFTIHLNGASTTIRKDSSAHASGNPGSQGTNGQILGMWKGKNTSYYMNGKIAELLIFEGTLSDSNRDLCEDYLAGKYNL